MSQGRELELIVRRALEVELRGGKLGIDPRAASMHCHKAYPSSAGRSPIVVDVAIEIRRESGVSPYLVWVWECKDYRRLVPVDDVEEFHGKLEQLGVHRTKGTIICRTGFQKGALTTAEHWGIGLARLLPEGSITRFLEGFRGPTRESVEFGLVEQDTTKLTTTFYGLTTNREPVTSVRELIRSELDSLSDSTEQRHRADA
jgi:hypothetical protein